MSTEITKENTHTHKSKENKVKRDTQKKPKINSTN